MRVTVTSPYLPDTYLSALKQNMESHIDISERFTGFFLGRCFTVTHHSGHEWNRRISNVKNTALGFVKETDEGCVVKFVRLKGFLAPTQFLKLLVVALFLNLFIPLADGATVDLFPFFPLVGIGLSLVLAPLETLMECMTEESWEGEKALLSLMMDPMDPYASLNKV